MPEAAFEAGRSNMGQPREYCRFLVRLARGEVVAVGDRYGVRILEIVDPEARVRIANRSGA